MTHERYSELIQRELDDDLTAAELALLEEHTATCAACRREREDYQQLAAGLFQLDKVMPEKSFVSRLTPEIQQAVEQAKEQTITRKRRFAPRWWQGTAAAAVVLLGVGFATNWSFTFDNTSDSVPIKVAETGSGADNKAPVAKTSPAAEQTDSATVAMGADTHSQTAGEVKAAEGASDTPVASDTTDATAGRNSSATGNTGAVNPERPRAQSTPGNGGATVVHLPAGTTDASGPLVANNSTAPADPSQAEIALNEIGRDVIGAPIPGDAALPDPNARAAGTVQPEEQQAGIAAFEGGEQEPVPDKDREAKSQTKSTSSHDRNQQGVNNGPAPVPTPLPKHPVTGPAPRMPDLNYRLQTQVNSGDQHVQWATDPVQVVRRELLGLGFDSSAVVHSSGTEGRVIVEQDGISYSVQLIQPFDTGEQGIWQPRQIELVP